MSVSNRNQPASGSRGGGGTGPTGVQIGDLNKSLLEMNASNTFLLQSMSYQQPFSAPQQQPFSAPQQQAFSAPQQQPFSAPQQQPFSAPQQQAFSAPQQQPFSAPQSSYTFNMSTGYPSVSFGQPCGPTPPGFDGLGGGGNLFGHGASREGGTGTHMELGRGQRGSVENEHGRANVGGNTGEIDGQNSNGPVSRYSGAPAPEGTVEGDQRMSGQPVDPASGSDLNHSRQTHPSQLLYESYPEPTCPEEEPIIRKDTRGMTKLSPAILKAKDRVIIKPVKGEMKFNITQAAKDISAAQRMNFKGDPTFGHTCRGTRDEQWLEFRMRYNWDPKDEKAIMEIWHFISGHSHINMMSGSKKKYKQGLKKNKLWRFGWMSTRNFLICRKRWDSEEEMEKSKQKQINGGVHFTEAGEAMKAPPTYIGGPIPMTEHAIQAESNSTGGDATGSSLAKKRLREIPVETPPRVLEFFPSVFRATHLLNGREIENMEGLRAAMEANGGQIIGDGGAPVVVTDVEEKWVNQPAHDLYERYTSVVRQKTSDNSSNIPTFDPALWAQSAGGTKHGKVRGVSRDVILYEAGFSSRRGHVLPPVPMVDASCCHEEKKKLEELTKDNKSMDDKVKKLHDLVLLLVQKESPEIIEKAKLIMEGTSSDGDDNSEENGDSVDEETEGAYSGDDPSNTS